MMTVKDLCPECSSPVVHVDGEVVCQNCGLIVNDQELNKGPERRSFTPEDRSERERTGPGATLLRHDQGLSTIIGIINRDAFGNHLPAKKQAELYRLRKWQQRTRVRGSHERTLAIGLGQLELFASKLALSHSLRENAAALYRMAIVKGLIKGRSVALIVAASLYFACRIVEGERCTHSLKDVARASNITVSDLGRAYTFLVFRLDKKSPPLQSATAYVSKIGAMLGIPGSIQGAAIRLLNTTKKCCVGKHSTGLAASALYIVHREAYKLDPSALHLTQRNLADAASVTEVTVRNLYKKLNRQLAIEKVSVQQILTQVEAEGR